MLVGRRETWAPPRPPRERAKEQKEEQAWHYSGQETNLQRLNLHPFPHILTSPLTISMAVPPPVLWTKFMGEPREGDLSNPPARWAHTVTPTSQGLVIFGGFAARRYKNDVWLLPPNMKAVKLRDTDTQGGDARAPYVSLDGLSIEGDESASFPSVRSNATALGIDDSVVVFGGGKGKDKLADAFLLGLRGGGSAPGGSGGRALSPTPASLTTCRLRHAPEGGVKPKTFAAGCRLTPRLFVVFGGSENDRDAEGKPLPNRDSEELYFGALDMSPTAWWATQATSSSKATPAAAPATPATTPLTHIQYPPLAIAWKTTSPTTSPLPPTVPWPPHRKCHVMVAAPVPFPTTQGAGLAIMHGGCQTDEYLPLDDLWVLMPLSLDCTRVALGVGEGERGGVFSFLSHSGAGSVGGGGGGVGGSSEELLFSWVAPVCEGGKPGARWGHAANLVPNRSPADTVFLIVGGFGHAGNTAMAPTGGSGAVYPVGGSVDLADVYVGELSVSVSDAENKPTGAPIPTMASYPQGYLASGARITWSKVDVLPSPGSGPFPPRRRLGAGVLTLPPPHNPAAPSSGAFSGQQTLLVTFGGFSPGAATTGQESTGIYHGDAWGIPLDLALKRAKVRPSDSRASVRKVIEMGGVGGGGGDDATTPAPASSTIPPIAATLPIAPSSSPTSSGSSGGGAATLDSSAGSTPTGKPRAAAGGGGKGATATAAAAAAAAGGKAGAAGPATSTTATTNTTTPQPPLTLTSAATADLLSLVSDVFTERKNGTTTSSTTGTASASTSSSFASSIGSGGFWEGSHSKPLSMASALGQGMDGGAAVAQAAQAAAAAAAVTAAANLVAAKAAADAQLTAVKEAHAKEVAVLTREVTNGRAEVAVLKESLAALSGDKASLQEGVNALVAQVTALTEKERRLGGEKKALEDKLAAAVAGAGAAAAAAAAGAGAGGQAAAKIQDLEAKLQEQKLKRITMEQKMECKSCMDKDACVVLLPCKHLVLCWECCEMLTTAAGTPAGSPGKNVACLHCNVKAQTALRLSGRG